jgi:hypothetical protein
VCNFREGNSFICWLFFKCRSFIWQDCGMTELWMKKMWEKVANVRHCQPTPFDWPGWGGGGLRITTRFNHSLNTERFWC